MIKTYLIVLYLSNYPDFYSSLIDKQQGNGSTLLARAGTEIEKFLTRLSYF